MNSVKYLLHILLFATLASACISPPDDFPSVPEITFEDLRFVNTSGADSLKVKIGFRDAEGDLGLNPTDINEPFNALNFRRNPDGSVITFSNRPPAAPNYNPIDWAINPLIGNTVVNDTVWVEQNPNHNNIFVRFFIKRNGTFTEFRWQDPPFFTTFNGRFPRILSANRTQAIEGSIEYAMLSFGWQSIFRNDTIRIDVEIQDRALNRSNTVSSPELTLSQISGG
ncbi:hypothetical protein [Belliella aquatica]|uniref:Lipoprotein n=1 Tax=Belliella aquatica TaxID=1323734 RepID=A0ABQ1MID7_9BACT|nr:hypothetical protein [Belliella aquatica]MCH7405129.1 hypothetical protein [Belliella aquatica]GGC39529.1 hypothetical protein GCM10010993_17870 [Belliella aquatica]